MQNLGAIVGQFRRLCVSDFVEHRHIFHQARISGHNAIDVRPDPQLLGIQGSRDYGGGEV